MERSKTIDTQFGPIILEDVTDTVVIDHNHDVHHVLFSRGVPLQYVHSVLAVYSVTHRQWIKNRSVWSIWKPEDIDHMLQNAAVTATYHYERDAQPK